MLCSALQYHYSLKCSWQENLYYCSQMRRTHARCCRGDGIHADLARGFVPLKQFLIPSLIHATRGENVADFLFMLSLWKYSGYQLSKNRIREKEATWALTLGEHVEDKMWEILSCERGSRPVYLLNVDSRFLSYCGLYIQVLGVKIKPQCFSVM